MAKARVRMVCADCGAEYWAEKTCCNRREADSWEAWMCDQEGCCPTCYAKRMAAQRQAKNDEAYTTAQAEAAQLGWPELTGSEKQVRWAISLRHDAMVAALERSPSHIKQEYLPLVAKVLEGHTEAKWWIDNRGQTWIDLRKEISAALK